MAVRFNGSMAETRKQLEQGIISQAEYNAIFSRKRLHGFDDDNPIMPFAVGGSDAGIIMGKSKWTSPLLLAKKKLHPESVNEAISGNAQFQFDYGHCLEDGVGDLSAMIMARKLGKDVKFESMNDAQAVSDKWEHCVATPDGFLVIDGDRYIADVKTTRSPETIEMFKSGNMPPEYLYQLYFYCGILGDVEDSLSKIKGACILAQCGMRESDFVQVFVDRNPEVEKRILDACEKFVENVSSGKEPAVTTSDVMSDEGLIKDVSAVYTDVDTNKPYITFSKDSGPILKEIEDITNELNEMSKVSYDAEKKKRALSERKKALLSGLMAEIGDAPGGVFSDGTSEYEVKVTHGFSKNADALKALKEKYPEAYEYFASISPTLSFRFDVKATDEF